MHTHVIRTVTRELADTMDYWGDPATGARDLQAHYCGGRDWVVTVQHPNHPADVEAPAHDDNAGGRLDEIGSAAPAAVEQQDYVRVEVYGSDLRFFESEGGPALPPDTAGLVEDVRRTWALWFGHDGRPKSLWLRRDASGACIGEPVDVSGG